MSDDLADFTAEIADQVESFLIALAELARGESPEHAVSLLLLEVSQLLLAGGRLGAIRDVVPVERFEPDAGFDPDADDLRAALARLLEPIDEYDEILDPYEPETVRCRISDDLSGVAADLTHGLAHYRAGRSDEALWWWQFSYLSSWGSTASAVLRALQSVVAHVRLDSPHDEVTQVEDALLAEVVAEATGADGPTGR
jgi:Domain of unknown function (DUF5063)